MSNPISWPMLPSPVSEGGPRHWAAIEFLDPPAGTMRRLDYEYSLTLPRELPKPTEQRKEK